MFRDVEEIIRRQIKVSNFAKSNEISFWKWGNPFLSNLDFFLCFLQMSILPSVQPFHAIAYPINPMLALEIRYHCITFCS
jgi:hypothetical protein